MSDQSESFNISRFGKSSNMGSGSFMSSHIINSHIRSISPSLRGGKKEQNIKYVKFRVHFALEQDHALRKILIPYLNQICENYYDYQQFKDTKELLNQDIAQQDLFYIFVKEKDASWAEKFSKQEFKESDGRKTIVVAQFLSEAQYKKKKAEREEVIKKNKKDGFQKAFYFINVKSEDYGNQLKDGLLQDLSEKLANKLQREGDRVKTWARNNKFKEKKSKKERLYIYIEKKLYDKLSKIYEKMRNKNGFKWTQIQKYNDYKNLMQKVRERQVDFIDEVQLVSHLSINPASKIFDKTQSMLKSSNQISGQSTISGINNLNKSIKDIVLEKNDRILRTVDKNFVIYSEDFDEKDKIYHFVMGQKQKNWQAVVYRDKNHDEIEALVKKIQQFEKTNEKDQIMKIIEAKTLYIFTYGTDSETNQIFSGSINNFNNRYLLSYNSCDQLLVLLNNYSRNQDDFTIVIIESEKSAEDDTVNTFINKHKLKEDNIRLQYRNRQINESLSMNSKVSGGDDNRVERFLKAIFDDRDRNFDPFNCYGDNYIYIFNREDKEFLMDEQLRQIIAKSARLKRNTYKDASYLHQAIKGVELKADHSIILTDDSSLREAQQVAKKFDKAMIMNVTDRKNVKEEKKVFAWGTLQNIKQVISSIIEKFKIENRKKYEKELDQYFQNTIPRRIPKIIQFKKGNNVTVKTSFLQTNKNCQIMEYNLNFHFKEELRVENYRKPEQVRLVNNSVQPLTFIICRDNKEDLAYMKEIAKQGKEDLHQQYILYSNQALHPFKEELFGKNDYQRFRFMSNSWRRIQQYIIGVMDLFKKGENKNKQIYEDELIHVFYRPSEKKVMQNFENFYNKTQAFQRTKFYQLDKLQQVCLYESPHHLYYVLVNTEHSHLIIEQFIQKIRKIQASLDARKVSPKKIMLVVYGKNSGVVRNTYIEAIFINEGQALDFLSRTRVLAPNYTILKPFIIIDKGSYDWYYFLDKYKDSSCYKFEFVDSQKQVVDLITKTRFQQGKIGEQFWYLTNNQKDANRFLEATNSINKGYQNYVIFHGTFPKALKQSKIKFCNPNREEVESFILNIFKRSHNVFSPTILRKKNPILAISKQNYIEIPLNPIELKKWREDLQLQELYFQKKQELSELPDDRNVILIVKEQQYKAFLQLPYTKNFNFIIYSQNFSSDLRQNSRLRTKQHRLSQTYRNINDIYYALYPAQLNRYLSYLRYNLKNSQQKLKNSFNAETIQVFLSSGVEIREVDVQKLCSLNKSIVQTFTFESLKQSVDKCIDQALRFEDYQNLFIITQKDESFILNNPNNSKINYIVYNPNERKSGLKINSRNLRTDEKQQYMTYLLNLPENRFNKAKQFYGKEPLKIGYQKKSKLESIVKELDKISKRNTNFVMVQFENIKDMMQYKQSITLLTDKHLYEIFMKEFKGDHNNITYFIYNKQNQLINLIAKPEKQQYFITKKQEEIVDYFHILRKADAKNTINIPLTNIPNIIASGIFENLSMPLTFKSNIDITKLKIFPQIRKNKRIAELKFNKINLHDSSKPEIFQSSSVVLPDKPMKPLEIEQQVVNNGPRPKPMLPYSLQIVFDNPPNLMEQRFTSIPDQSNTIPRPVPKPGPKSVDKKLAIVFPDNKQHKEIFAMLQTNLCPKPFQKIQSIPYSDLSLQHLLRSENKFLGFDRTVVFLPSKNPKFVEEVQILQNKLKGKIECFVFDDNFHQMYSKFAEFLSPYNIRLSALPYINSVDPLNWHSSNMYRIMVPIAKKKLYNSLKSNNIVVSPYNDEEDIRSQLHHNNEFVVIVCDKRKYHQLKHLVNFSSRCIIFIEDNEQLRQDQIVLFKYPKKVLFYGNDALKYIKVRIPTKPTVKSVEPMKVIFFKKSSNSELGYVMQDDFSEYEKVSYVDSQDLFIKLIDKQFLQSVNYKVPHSLKIVDKIRLHPKIYIQKNSPYRGDNGMKKFLTEFGKYGSIHEKQFRKNFKTILNPEQYMHLNTVQFDTPQELKNKLEVEQTPCLVFLDINNKQHSFLRDNFSKKHLFIEIFEVVDRWINNEGYLIPADKLSRQELAQKQSLFTDMFNMNVFNAYNDMGFYYLSNKFRIVEKKTRNITFMTREQLVEQFKKNPNLLMIIFVQNIDRRFIPTQFYDEKIDYPKEDRVKLIFINQSFIHSENILYIKYNEIDPAFLNITRTEEGCRNDYCIYPDYKPGQVKWHNFAGENKGYKPIPYTSVNQFDNIAQDIKGNYRHAHVICNLDDESYIRSIFDQYSIKNKPGANQKLTFAHISQADMRSFIAPANKSKMITTINFQNVEDDKQKFETVGHQIDVKPSSSNALYSNINYQNNSALEDVIQSKQFIIQINETLKDTFPVGNLYTNGVKSFKSISQIDPNSASNQLIISDENLGQLKTLVSNNQKLYLIYVSEDKTIPPQYNSVVIPKQQIPKLISKFQNIQKGKQVESGQNEFLEGRESKHSQVSGQKKNLEDFKIVRILYDEGLDKQTKKQILLASYKNKNVRPYLFKDVQELKRLVKEQGSISVLLFSKQPPNLKNQLEKQNMKIIKNKRGRRVVVPKYLNNGIDGLSTILEQEQSDFDNINKQALNQDVDTYLKIMQNNPEKGRKYISIDPGEPKKKHSRLQIHNNQQNQELPKQDSDKLNLHSKIAENQLKVEGIEWIKQRLDGGILVLFVEKASYEQVSQLKKKYNILLQEYNHIVNLKTSVRDKKDKFTIVLIHPNSMNQIKQIKDLHQKLVFGVVNPDGIKISPEDRKNIAFEVSDYDKIEEIIGEIYQQNQRIKYDQNMKIPSKADNKRTSYVDNGNSWRLSNGYQNTKVKNAFVFYKQDQNKNLKKKIQHINNITYVGYKDLQDAQKKFDLYNGYQQVVIANDKDIPEFEDFILKKKDQAYIIKINPPDDYKENPKIKKNILLSAYSQDQVANFLIEKFPEGPNTTFKSQEKPKEGKYYAPRYQPNGFGTTPRFPSQKDYVPYKNDPIYSSRGLKSVSRESKMRVGSRESGVRNAASPYYNR